MEQETKDAWAVVVNTDLTEGRGRDYVKHICEVEATAERLASGANVQGTDGTIVRVKLEKRGSAWFGPVRIELPTDNDQRRQALMDTRRAVVDRARDLGLTEDEISVLRASD